VSTALAAAMAKSDLNEYIGDIGPYQWRVFAVVFLFTIYCTDSIQIIFLGAELPHWCRVPALDDLPHHVQKNVAIPAVQYSRAEITCVRVFILFFYFIGYLLVGIFLGFQSTLHIASCTGCPSSAKCMRLLMHMVYTGHCISPTL